MWVKKIDGTTYMMVSYWDAGQILLDVDDPENPVYVDDQDFPEPDQFGYTPPEGNAHQGTWSENNKLFIETNEDFAPYRIGSAAGVSNDNRGSRGWRVRSRRGERPGRRACVSGRWQARCTCWLPL